MFGNLFYFLYLKFRVKDNSCICKYWYLILLPLYNCAYKTHTHARTHSLYSMILAQHDNYIIFGVFTFLGVAGVILMFFIVPVSKKKVIA